MALTNAEKQARWRERNVIVLTGSPWNIAGALIEMEDQGKLREIARLIDDHLKHPEQTSVERWEHLRQQPQTVRKIAAWQGPGRPN